MDGQESAGSGRAVGAWLAAHVWSFLVRALALVRPAGDCSPGRAARGSGHGRRGHAAELWPLRCMTGGRSSVWYSPPHESGTEAGGAYRRQHAERPASHRWPTSGQSVMRTGDPEPSARLQAILNRAANITAFWTR